MSFDSPPPKGPAIHGRFLERRAISLTALKSPSELIRKAGLDDIDAQCPSSHLGRSRLLLEAHGGAGALFAVRVGGVEI